MLVIIHVDFYLYYRKSLENHLLFSDLCELVY
jgi:hypothetical protein